MFIDSSTHILTPSIERERKRQQQLRNYALLVTVLHTVQVNNHVHNNCSKYNEQKEITITHIGVYRH